MNQSSEWAIFVVGGANTDYLARGPRLPKPGETVQGTVFVPLDCVNRAAQLAHEAGVQVFLDPAPAVPLTQDLLRLVELVKPNSTEAQILTGIEVADRDSARRAAHYLLDRGVQAVAIEAGNKGNLIVTGDEEHWLPLIPVDSVDATGAGDAFITALAVARVEGRSWREAGEFANAAAALTTTHLGAQAALPTREQVVSLLQTQEKV